MNKFLDVSPCCPIPIPADSQVGLSLAPEAAVMLSMHPDAHRDFLKECNVFHEWSFTENKTNSGEGTTSGFIFFKPELVSLFLFKLIWVRFFCYLELKTFW